MLDARLLEVREWKTGVVVYRMVVKGDDFYVEVDEVKKVMTWLILVFIRFIDENYIISEGALTSYDARYEPYDIMMIAPYLHQGILNVRSYPV